MECVCLTQETLSNYHPSEISEWVKQLLLIQHELLWTTKLKLPENTVGFSVTSEQREILETSGFLVGKMAMKYLQELLEEVQTSIIFIVEPMESKIYGYAILTSPAKYKDILNDLHLASALDKKQWNDIINNPNIRYITQMGIINDARRTGLGTFLIEKCKTLYSDGLLAGMMLEPLENKASYKFFTSRRNGFSCVGYFDLQAMIYSGNTFPPTKTTVVIWKTDG
ncbi:unnamed protein product [Didymodactylos carnosus]|uniref:N-acetyltransferase domain-containing protein n=1 Tax=Didymodactylos carnosus TaxID=1234261 RepID=A0A815CIM2_9BILA|nr:unnamed protein product [Didymodactylos carnosus]CAF1318342.1 unnamed protein product [Didymodactylos carnosus]CAF4083216.1 unnamed protein product [Didymodactylos carnosus]CAF4127801.1 unnamed protein product [Didymodactylos carnosus]